MGFDTIEINLFYHIFIVMDRFLLISVLGDNISVDRCLKSPNTFVMNIPIFSFPLERVF